MRPLVLDGGGLVVDPPRANDATAYSGDDAVCEVLASTLSNNGPVPRQSRNTIAVGLGRATVADRLLHGHSNLDQGQSFGMVDGIADVNPKRPAPSTYHDRLAWVVVVQDLAISSCPAMTVGQSPPSYDEPGHHGYAVFLVDAATGGDALLYTERRNGICPGSKPSGPWVDVPLTSISVPWRLLSEQPDRSSAQISFEVTPCDGYSGVTLADEDSDPALVRVLVQRPFGPPCAQPRRIVEKMRAARLGTDLPPRLEHAPVGPYVQ
ncbi:MAG TPA: hypothetical protein VFT62_06585 [Mycobacteriales bacterium]|nr:hypothetical protein [Mycobacteriales bacterium]